jgi:hypothetical protein
MTDEPIDLSHLAPVDPGALIRAVELRTAAVLAERRAHTTTMQLAAWWPVVSAAAVIIAIASALMLTLEPRPAAPVMARTTPVMAASPRTALARALGMPGPLVLSLARDQAPTAEEFLRELGR